MANLELVFNPKKLLRRNDVIEMGKTIKKAAKDKRVDTLIIKITDDRKDGENSMMFPFRIIDDLK